MIRSSTHVIRRASLLGAMCFSVACGGGSSGDTDAGPDASFECPTLENPVNGSLSFSNANQPQSIATYSCYGDWFLVGEPTRRCLNREWEGPAPTCRPPTYTDSATNLTWQVHTTSEDVTQAMATSYCSDLVLDAHDDWRLPTIRELVSVVDFTESYGLDLEVFPTAMFHWRYWSSTPMVGAEAYWITGSTGWGGSVVETTYGMHARCVRGAPLTPPSLSVGVDATTVGDATSGLLWTSTAANNRSQSEAMSHCAALSPAGTWRLPTAHEFLSIIDFTRSIPAIDTSLFPGAGQEYWTSTPFVADDDEAFVINLDVGGSGRRFEVEYLKALCVH